MNMSLIPCLLSMPRKQVGTGIEQKVHTASCMCVGYAQSEAGGLALSWSKVKVSNVTWVSSWQLCIT